MDDNSIHGPGISNFSPPPPSQHRMPTVSAAQALQDLTSSPKRYVSTGLQDLDCILRNGDPTSLEYELPNLPGGISRGQVTEVYGPPGVGKTAMGMQLAAGVLHAGEGVIWVDASHPVPGQRFSQIINSHPSSTSPPRTISELAKNLTHFSIPTLSHLIALISNPTPTHPPPNTALIIIDSLSTLMTNAFPKTLAPSSTDKTRNAFNNPSTRKFPLLQHLTTSLQKLSTTRNIAILILSPCATKMRPGVGASLVPAINTTAWEQGLACRIALFRDWGYEDDKGNEVNDVRFAQVVKSGGNSVSEGRGRLVGFSVTENGLIQLKPPNKPTQTFPSTSPLKSHPTHQPTQTHTHTHTHTIPRNHLPQKRKLSPQPDQSTFPRHPHHPHHVSPHVTPREQQPDPDPEIPDSDAEPDEDYGWGEEDEEELPPPPPQWQGSEDILIPDPAEQRAYIEGTDEEEEDEDEEEDELGEFGRDDGVNAKENRGEIAEDEEDELGGDGNGGMERERERVIEDSEDELA